MKRISESRIEENELFQSIVMVVSIETGWGKDFLLYITYYTLNRHCTPAINISLHFLVSQSEWSKISQLLRCFSFAFVREKMWFCIFWGKKGSRSCFFTLSLFNLLYGQMDGDKITPTQTKKIKSTDIHNPNNGCGMYELICHCYIHTRTRVAWIILKLKVWHHFHSRLCDTLTIWWKPSISCPQDFKVGWTARIVLYKGLLSRSPLLRNWIAVFYI